MVVWDNSSGFIRPGRRSAAWYAGLIAAGASGTWNQDHIGGTLPAPYMINSADPSQHVQSFNLHFGIPEPTTLALAGLGAAALVMCRNRNNLTGR